MDCIIVEARVEAEDLHKRKEGRRGGSGKSSEEEMKKRIRLLGFTLSHLVHRRAFNKWQ